MRNNIENKPHTKIKKLGKVGGTVLAAAMALEASPVFAQGVTTFNSEPSASSTPDKAFTIVGYGSVEPGTTVTLPANTTVEGDPLLIDGKAWSDTNAFSGGVTVLTQEAQVQATANYGFSYHTFENQEQADTQAIAEAQDMTALGCADGCEVVDVLHYPGTSQKAWDMSGRPVDDDLGVITVTADGIQINNGPEAQPTQAPEITDPGKIREYVTQNPNMDSSVAVEMLNTLIQSGFDVNDPANQDTLQALIACICKCKPGEVPTQTPKPTPTPTPSAEPCDTIQDIEHGYEGWMNNGFDRSKAPHETEEVTKAIFQSDGAWKKHGTKNWHTSYDSNSETAQIYVFDFAKPQTLDFSFDYGGDLQKACVTLPDTKFEDRLKSDIKETFKANSNVRRIHVTTVTANGVSSKWVNR